MMTDYYVDSYDGDDGESGTEAQPWQTLARVESEMGSLQPGDVVHLKRGSDWSAGGFTISCDGVTFQPYSDGPRPIIRHSRERPTWSWVVRITGRNNVLRDVLIRDAHEAGIIVLAEATGNTIEDVEVTAVGTCILLHGGNDNVVHGCHLHDAVMTVNTPGGDDDFGAMGVGFENGASGNEVRYCHIVDNLAESYDYGMDGGAFEFNGDGVNNNICHHNRIEGNDGVYECDARGGSQRGNKLHHNVCLNNRIFGGMHGANSVSDFVLEHNTVVEENPNEQLILFWSGTPDRMTAYNNIFWSDNRAIAGADVFEHSHNVFYRPDGGSLGLALGTGEVNDNPLFVDLVGGDFRLRAGSEAIGRGINLGYDVDYDGNIIGSPPDCGAYQYGGMPGTGGNGDMATVVDELMQVIEALRAQADALNAHADTLSAVVTGLEVYDAQADELAVEAQELADKIDVG